MSVYSFLCSTLPKHPLPIRTTFRNCFLVNFRMEPATLARVLPHPIVPDLYKGKAHLSIVIADLEYMRPAFLPKPLGFNFHQVVYRAIVRNTNKVDSEYGPEGERGVYFVRSDANDKFMCFWGNLLSFFKFNYTESLSQIRTTNTSVDTIQFLLKAREEANADIHTLYDMKSRTRNMPSYSAFPNLEEAQKYFVELYQAFSSNEKYISTVRIKRSPWRISLVEDSIRVYNFMNGSTEFPVGSCEIDSIFYVEDLEYHWFVLEREKIHSK